MTMVPSTDMMRAGARSGARSVWRRRLRGHLTVLACALALAGCETGPEMVSNSVAQCTEYLKKLPTEYREPYCRCLGTELERNFNYAQIRQYRLATDNWTYFLDVPVDSPLMRINRLCLARHVPEELR
jgi:hypothetical protein